MLGHKAVVLLVREHANLVELFSASHKLSTQIVKKRATCFALQALALGRSLSIRIMK